MSNHLDRDGFSLPSLFLFSKQETFLEQVKKGHLPLAPRQKLFPQMTLQYGAANGDMLEQACERVALSFMLEQSDLAKRLLSDEDFEKACAVFARKQFNSKILQSLLDCFSLFLTYHCTDQTQNSTYFFNDIRREYRHIMEEEADHRFAPLRRHVNAIVSGVNASCYFQARDFRTLLFEEIPQKWNDRLKAATGYDFNRYSCQSELWFTFLLSRDESVRELFSVWQKALFNDENFWSNNPTFSVFSFLEDVEKANSTKHAEKLFDFMCNALQKMPHVKELLKSDLPLYMQNKALLVKRLEERAHRFAFQRLVPYCNTLSLTETEVICTPMLAADAEKIKRGKEIFHAWLRNCYPNNANKVLDFLHKEIERFISGETKEDDDIAIILDGNAFGYTADSVDRYTFALYFKDCFISENILNRVYLTTYAVSLLSNDPETQYRYLYRTNIDLLNAIEKKAGISTAQRTDSTSREKEYCALKKKLQTFGIEISDRYKADYILALLDRDTALLDEQLRFAEIEQLGDAIFGFAVAERLFYQTQRVGNYATEIENYTRAEAQVIISKKIGFDKLYLDIRPMAKYEERDSLYNDFDVFAMREKAEQSENSEKYLADSLEMIIGVLSRDQGIEVAIDFAKMLLTKTFSDRFPKSEIRYTEENKHRISDLEFWSSLLPAPGECRSGVRFPLSLAFDKLVLVALLGTEDKKKRQYITYAVGGKMTFGKQEQWAFHDYLHKGLPYILSAYKETVIDNYRETQKH